MCIFAPAMKNKGWIIVIIILLPSLIWVLLDVSLIKSKKLNYFGPKKLAENGKDTIYYAVKNLKFYTDNLKDIELDTNHYKVFIIDFIKPEYLKDKFRIGQFLSMERFNPEKISHIPIILVYPFHHKDSVFHLKDSLKISSPNVQSLFLPDSLFNKTLQQFFILKPYYVDYSFAILIDKNRNIRGYYDWRYADEVKRSIQEFNHLIIKEGYKETLNKNKIEQRYENTH
jgi:hypothetical protein